MPETMIPIPSIICNIDGTERMTDVLTWDFQKRRVIYIYDEINNHLAASISAQLRYLYSKSHDPITIMINSRGGEVPAGLSIIDTIHSLDLKVATVVTGIAASMAAVIAAVGGTPGMRYASELAEFMIHQPFSQVRGSASDILLASDHLVKVRKKICKILAAACKKKPAVILAEMDRDNYFSSEEAVTFGLADTVGIPSFQMEGAML